MALTTEELRRIATLARLRLPPEQEAAFARQLGRIVDYIDQLQSFRAEEGDAPASQPVRETPEAADRPLPCLPRELFLANAPASALGEFLAVPEVKGGGDA